MHSGSRGLTATERWTLRVAPALGVAAIVASALGFTEPEARWALIYAGPTDQPGARMATGAQAGASQAWRIAVKSGNPARANGFATRAHLRVSSRAGKSAKIPFQTDADGLAWVTVDRTVLDQAQPIEAAVVQGGRELANGSLSVPLSRWAAGKRSDGGWCTGFHEGPVEIKLGIVDGVLLHGFPSAAVVALRENGRAVANQPVLLESDGARIVTGTGSGKLMLTSDTGGLVRFLLQSSDMAATLRVTVPAPKESQLTASLPIRAGGMRAFRSRDRIIVSTSIPTSKAWLGLLTEQGLTRVQSLELEERAGNWTGSASFADWPKPPLWAVVSTEPELESMNTLGWPLLDEGERDRAHSTLVTPNVLALDGKPQVLQRLEKQRQRAIISSSIALLVVAALVTWVVLRSNRRHQRQVRELAQLLEGDRVLALTDRTPLALIAVIVTTAALVALAFWFAL